jgi:hypothetical protein
MEQPFARPVARSDPEQSCHGAANAAASSNDHDEPGIRREEYWWYVPIRPSVEPVKRYEYYEVLAEVEGELDEKEQLKVFLVPGASREVQPA